MKTYSGAVLGACFLMVSLSACSGSSPGSQTSPDASANGGGGVCSAKGCTLLTATDVASAMGGESFTGTENDIGTTIVGCDYADSGQNGTSVHVAIQCLPSPPSDADLRSDLALYKTITPVSGVGSSAFFGSPASTAGGPNTAELYGLAVARGNHTLVFQLGGNHGHLSSFDPLTVLKAVANTTLARL